MKRLRVFKYAVHTTREGGLAPWACRMLTNSFQKAQRFLASQGKRPYVLVDRVHNVCLFTEAGVTRREVIYDAAMLLQGR